MSLFASLFLLTVTHSYLVHSASYSCSGIAQYWLSFYGNWSAATHPNAFPSTPTNGFFSPLVGASHEDAYTMWDAGMLASKGIKAVAETGNSAALENELMARIMYNKTAWKLIKSVAIGSTSSVMNIEVEVTKDFPLVSLVSMLAPSPDWFTGIKKVSLCNTSSGLWLDSLTTDMLHPWDAGTDDGATFDAANAATIPPGFITMITKSAPPTSFMQLPGPSIPTMGKMIFTRTNKPLITQCSGEATYTVKFEAKWSVEIHPNGFPSGAHFSPLVIATHTYRYKVWSDMTRASPGVKIVAETGVTSILDSEIMQLKKSNFVYMVYRTLGAVNAPGGETSMKIVVKDKYSMVSLITMIAPSPDWFVGVDSYDLCGSDGRWKDTVIMDLLPWDAGTDSGTSFQSSDIPTIPSDVIKRITSNSNTQMGPDADKAFARVSLARSSTISTMAATAATVVTAATASPSLASVISIATTTQTFQTTTPTNGAISVQHDCRNASLFVFIVALIRAFFKEFAY